MYSSVQLCKEVKQSPIQKLSDTKGKQAGKHTDGYTHVLEDIGAERGVYFLPAAQVGCGLVEQVAISGRQQVSHEYDGRADRDQDEQLTGPTLVHVLRALKEKCTCRKGWGGGWRE